MRQVNTHRVKVGDWSRMYWALTEINKAAITIIISDKAKVKKV